MNLNYIRQFQRKQEVLDGGGKADLATHLRYCALSHDYGEDSLPHKTSTAEIFNMKKTIYQLVCPKIVFTF